MNRRVRVHGTHNDLELALHASRMLRRCTNDRHATSALAIQAEVLRERLAHEQLEATAHEQPNGSNIVVQITSRKALVGAVEQRHMVLALCPQSARIEQCKPSSSLSLS